DVGDAAYVILSGKADILIQGPNGEIKVAEVGPNAIVGEIAILCDVARTATVKALTQVEALRIGKENFFKLLMDFPEMTVEMVRVLANRLTHTTAELTEALSQQSKTIH
ncbi:MAG: cyclic nucleotide-binding domain-containing protein, partial [Gemmobacter sp.]|nr:cyclic nucleotide-binding domain-containing protein [Gemmobacter sp.]